MEVRVISAQRQIPWERVVVEPLARARHAELAESHRRHSAIATACEVTEAIRSFSFPREEVSRLLVEACKQSNAPEPSIRAASRLAERDAVAVITGQQPGFVGGPLSTFYKAAHAVVLAKEIERASGCPTVALFWNHSDDHDLDETRGISIPDAQGIVHRMALDLGRGRPFLSDVTIPENALDVWQRFESLLPAGADRERVVELFRPIPGGRFAADTSRILLKLLGPLGLVVFEPRDIRAPLSRALADVVCHVEPGQVRLARQASDLRKNGFAPPFDEKDPSLVYVRTGAGRERLHYENKLFTYPSGEKQSAAELARAIQTNPELFTAGVACRLVTEALALPVVAVIRGPAELAYAPCALSFMAPEFDRRAPVEIPRFSATLVEARVARSLAKMNLTIEAALGEESEVTKPTSVATESAPEASLRSLELEVQNRLHALGPQLRDVDSNLERPLEKTLSTVASALSTLRGKVRRSIDDQSQVGEARLKRVVAWLWPNGKPQERMFPVAPFLCSGIEKRTHDLVDAVVAVPTSHSLLVFEETDPTPA